MFGINNKLKIFLAAFTNQTNAQNLSCRALAKYLDKERFEVYTLEINHGNLSKLRLAGVRVFNCRFPVRFSGILGLIWGFYHADVVYLPRGIFLKWQQLLVRLFKVKSFKTVRNVIDDEALKSAMSQVIKPTNGDIKKAYDFVGRIYAMTPYMANYNHKRWGIKSEEQTLLPPSEIQGFQDNARIREVLKEVIFIGNDWKRKGLTDYLALAEAFPSLQFHVVGKGSVQYYKDDSPSNVKFHGLLTGSALIDLMVKSDLHILPSRSEGLPRVLIETMANGLPSVLYEGYGAEEFISNGSNGFVLTHLLEAKTVLQQILANKISLQALSQACLTSSKQFEPKKLTEKYEEVIRDIYNA